MVYQLIALIIFIITVIAFAMAVFHAIFYAPFVPTPHKIVKKMIQAANIKKGTRVIDLGAGDGRITIMAAQKGAKATGYELSWFPFLLAKLQIWLQKSKAKIVKKNFMNTSLSEADYIFCYLWPRLMKSLQRKFEKELKKGTKVISYCFPIKEWTPVKKVSTQKNNRKTFLIYVYEIGTSNK